MRTTAKLRELYIDRIYDTYIDEEQLQACDMTVKKIADSPAAQALFLAGVHPRDGPLPDPARRQEGLARRARLPPQRPHLLPGLHRLERRLRPGQAPGGPSRPAPDHRLHPRFLRAHPDQDGGQDHRHLHDRRRGAQELRPGHGHLRRGAGPGGAHAQVRRADHRGRRARRRLLEFHPQGGLLLGQGGHDLRADGLRRGQHRSLPLIVSCLYHQKDWKKRKRREWSKLFA
ncbi:MAG: hypothetical protein MZU91_14845 [Desulfosudis oleivorans]|nr:hypothetical protein [Desulfosudis oleivorans]